MKQQEIFGLGVRFVGLFCLYQGLMALPGEALGFWRALWNLGLREMAGNVFVVAYFLVVSYLLLRGAPFLLSLAYPGQERLAGDAGKNGPA